MSIALGFNNVALPMPRVLRPASTRSPHVVAELGYLKPMSERPYNYMYEPPEGTPWQNCEYALHAMPIGDARCLPQPPSVHHEGFALWDAPTAMRDFDDEAAIARRYYPEALELALAATGAKRGQVFDHLVRRREPGRPPLGFGRRGDGSNPAAVGRVHNDYTEASGPRRLELVLGSRAAASRVRRYAIVNIWRSIKGPVLDTPLAVCDARSVSAADLVTGEVRYPTRNGEIYLLTQASAHRWWYYPRMDRPEALVFKQYDSQLGGVARYTPHAAFDHPDTPPDAPLRQSIEVRCLVMYE
jgi:hypothetical protein